MGNGSVSEVCDDLGKCKCRDGFAGDTCNECAPGRTNFPECCADTVVKGCADDKTACAKNKNGMTACFADLCVVPVEEPSCSDDVNACAANNNGRTACFGGKCVVPVEEDDCSNNSTTCAGNTNGCIACFNGECVIPIEVDDCSSDGGACAANTNGCTACFNGECVVPVEVTSCLYDANACKNNTNGLNVCLDGKCVSADKCEIPKFIGDGYCDDENNKEACNFDQGDCCPGKHVEVKKDYCTVCACLGDSGAGATTQQPTTTTEKEVVIDCLKGYTGEKCNKCEKGYHVTEGWKCQLGYSKSYPEEGIISCDLSAKKCICKEGYTGDLCQNCPTGYSPIFVIVAFSCTNDQSLIDAYLKSKFGNGPGLGVECKKCYTGPNGECGELQKGYAGGNCEECLKGYTGSNCNDCDYDNQYHITSSWECAFGYGKLPTEGIISCDVHQEKCTCKEGYTGVQCQICPSGYYSSFFIDAASCKECECNENGTKPNTVCNPINGKCECLDNYTGDTCSRCKGLEHCKLEGIGEDIDRDKNPKGKCVCLEGYIGEKCDKCDLANGFGIGKKTVYISFYKYVVDICVKGGFGTGKKLPRSWSSSS